MFIPSLPRRRGTVILPGPGGAPIVMRTGSASSARGESNKGFYLFMVTFALSPVILGLVFWLLSMVP